MITVKKDAIKFKTSDGMQSAGVLANVGVAKDWFHYMSALSKAFYGVDFGTSTDLDIFLGKNVEASVPSAPLEGFAVGTKNLRSVKLKCKSPESKSIAFSSVFQNSSVEVIDLSEFILSYTSVSQTFRDCKKLVSILGKINISSCSSTSNAFLNCSSLADVEFVENSIKVGTTFSSSPLLSDASVQSIIDGLVDLTGQTTQNIVFHMTVKAKLTEAQISQITSKNWTLA